MIVHCEQPPLIDKNGWRTCYYYIIGGFSHNAKATTTTRTAGGLFVSQSFVFGNNQKLHNEKQGHALTINALVSSDSVLIPVQAAYLPVKGLQQLIKTILTVKKRLNRKLAIEGILLTMVDFRTNYARDIASRVHTTYGSQIEVFENVIPMSVKAAETSAEGKSIYMHCPKGKVAEAYMKLTQEVLNNEK